MKYADHFELSDKLHPGKGYHLSKAACGFLAPELEGIVAHYKKELEDPTMSEQLRRMTAHHLAGLEHLLTKITEGYNK